MSFLPFPEKIQLIFALFRPFLVGSTARSKVEGLESKTWPFFLNHSLPTQFLVNLT